jgi:hypothetical protein
MSTAEARVAGLDSSPVASGRNRLRKESAMAKHADGPISGRMIFTENPMRMSAEGGMTLKSGDETIAEYTKGHLEK